MAKKHNGKSVSWLVQYLYDHGVLQSTIFHTIIFLCLSLIIVSEHKNSAVLYLSFNSDSQQPVANLSYNDDIDSLILEQSKKISKEETPLVVMPLPDQNIEIPFVESYINEIKQEFNTKDLMKYYGSINSSQQDDIAVESVIDNIRKSIGNGSTNTGQFNGLGNVDEFSRRLSDAGAKTGDIQISIMWETIDDIDLHVSYTPGNGLVDYISWQNRTGRLTSGMLDVDRNATSNMLVQQPVENIFWPPNSSPKGHFIVMVHFYRSWSGNNKVPVIVRIKVGNKIAEYKVLAILYQSPMEVNRFIFPMK